MPDEISDDLRRHAHLPIGEMFGEDGAEQRVVGKPEPDRKSGAQSRAEVGQFHAPHPWRHTRRQQQAAAAFPAGVEQMQQQAFLGAIGIVDRDPMNAMVEQMPQPGLVQRVSRDESGRCARAPQMG